MRKTRISNRSLKIGIAALPPELPLVNAVLVVQVELETHK